MRWVDFFTQTFSFNWEQVSMLKAHRAMKVESAPAQSATCEFVLVIFSRRVSSPRTRMSFEKLATVKVAAECQITRYS